MRDRDASKATVGRDSPPPIFLCRSRIPGQEKEEKHSYFPVKYLPNREPDVLFLGGRDTISAYWNFDFLFWGLGSFLDIPSANHNASPHHRISITMQYFRPHFNRGACSTRHLPSPGCSRWPGRRKRSQLGLGGLVGVRRHCHLTGSGHCPMPMAQCQGPKVITCGRVNHCLKVTCLARLFSGLSVH